MQIEGIIWLRDIEDKLAIKHGVETYEVEEALGNHPGFRFVTKGQRTDEDVYLALGQTDAGRYLAVIFIYKQTKEALILSARDMARKERRLYGRKK
ncbi:MAG: BrnT family toxin [Roseiflexaceae bacterium]